jgi:small subunit ribosomal protein S1
MSTRPINPEEDVSSSADQSFADILNEYEQSHRQAPEAKADGREGTVVAISSEFVFVDIGLKTEGVIPVTAFPEGLPAQGDKIHSSITGRNPEGYYLLSKIKVSRPKDWSSLESAFAEKRTIAGVVSGVVKGGLSVDVGVRAFMPASRSGAREAADLEALVGQEISCKIIKLDVADEDVVVDRRVVLEQEDRDAKERIYSNLKEGTVLRGTVRTLADYGAFVDIGGVDGLLHVADLSWGRVGKPSDVLKVGDSVDVQVLKIDPKKRRISLGMKQLLPDPWSQASEKFKAGDRINGVVTRVTDFGAFVELLPGLEGLIHLSEMSWSRKVRKPSDVVKPGDAVEAVILGVNPGEHRISLGLKQALGDPWADAEKKYAEGTVVEGPVVSLAKFGAFVDLGDGIEGMIHVGDLSAEKRIDHPQDMLKTGQVVRAAVLGVDRERRRIRLGMKQLQPTSIDEYIAEHKEGDVVTGRVSKVSGASLSVELGEGVHASCKAKAEEQAAVAEKSAPAQADLSSLTSMLQSKWKRGGSSGPAVKETVKSGQVRSFRIVKLDPAAKRIELEAV